MRFQLFLVRRVIQKNYKLQKLKKKTKQFKIRNTVHFFNIIRARNKKKLQITK